MFIVHLKDKILVEGVNTWDDIPDGISQLQVGTFGGELITLPKCEKYFYSTEAVASLEINPTSAQPRPPLITAKIIGGIFGNQAIYIRIDTKGYIDISFKKVEELPFVPKTYKKGI